VKKQRFFLKIPGLEYGPRGVRVFSVSPGYMQTSLTEKWDARLLDAIRAAARNSEPSVTARKVLEPAAGNGEDHAI
jgi:NAD(P)-dependent dehydrogenase (short-subunit alcohol dehydrogenase family)